MGAFLGALSKFCKIYASKTTYYGEMSHPTLSATNPQLGMRDCPNGRRPIQTIVVDSDLCQVNCDTG